MPRQTASASDFTSVVRSSAIANDVASKPAGSPGAAKSARAAVSGGGGLGSLGAIGSIVKQSVVAKAIAPVRVLVSNNIQIVTLDATQLNTIATYLRNYMAEFRNPNFHAYTMDSDQYKIADGGSDMFDFFGNFTYPWLINGTDYSQRIADTTGNQAVTVGYANTTPRTIDSDFVYVSLGYTQGTLGQNPNTLTPSHPLTVLGIRTNVGSPVGFQVSGASGHDGEWGRLVSSTLYSGTVIQGFTVYAFYREICDAIDASVCHLNILIGHPRWGSEFGTVNSYTLPWSVDGHGYYHYTSGPNVKGILAVKTLLSKLAGAEVTATECQTVVQSFVNRIKIVTGF